MIWDKLKIVRELLGYSQADVAEKTGIKQKDISLLEGGKKKFIPNEYIHFLYMENVRLDTIFDDSLTVSLSNNNNTPSQSEEFTPSLVKETTHILHPKTQKSLHPTLHPTRNLGVPQVVTVTEDDRELISLVPHKAAAGYLNGYADPEYVESLPTVRLPNLGAGTHRAFEIKGHSMNPTLYNGSMSIGRWVESFEDIRDRRIYIVVTKSEGIVTKRVLNRINESGKLILISDNQNKKDYPNVLLDAEDVLELWYQRANLSFEFPEPDLIHNRMNDTEARLTLLEDKIKHLLK